jgi:hypothetical protein
MVKVAMGRPSAVTAMIALQSLLLIAAGTANSWRLSL